MKINLGFWTKIWTSTVAAQNAMASAKVCGAVKFVLSSLNSSLYSKLRCSDGKFNAASPLVISQMSS